MAAPNPVLRIRDVCALAPILKNVEDTKITREEVMKLAKQWRRENCRTLPLADGIDLDTGALVNAVNAIPEKEPDLTHAEVVSLFALMYANRDKYPNFWPDFCEQLKSGVVSIGVAIGALSVWNINTAPLEFPQYASVLKRFDELLAERVNYGNGVLHEFNILYTRYENMGPISKVKEWPSIFAFNRAIGSVFGRWQTVSVAPGVGVRFGTEVVMASPSDNVSEGFVKYGHLCAIKINN